MAGKAFGAQVDGRLAERLGGVEVRAQGLEARRRVAQRVAVLRRCGPRVIQAGGGELAVDHVRQLAELVCHLACPPEASETVQGPGRAQQVTNLKAELDG